jgi:hypothetical protein
VATSEKGAPDIREENTREECVEIARMLDFNRAKCMHPNNNRRTKPHCYKTVHSQKTPYIIIEPLLSNVDMPVPCSGGGGGGAMAAGTTPNTLTASANWLSRQ